MHNIPGGDIAEGDEIVEYSPKYEHERSKGIKRFVVLIYKQKHRLNVSGKVIYLKRYKNEINFVLATTFQTIQIVTSFYILILGNKGGY